MADWAKNTKKLESVGAIHDGTPYVQGLVEAFTKKFTSLGGKVVAVEAINPQDVDMRPMLTRLSISLSASGRPSSAVCRRSSSCCSMRRRSDPAIFARCA